MKERRQYKRFTATLPARLEVITSGRKKVYDLETKNISASGAFVYTKGSFFPEDARFTLDLTIPSDSIKELAEVKSFIECDGSLVRSTSEGMAMHFDRECYIMSLRGS
jgi:PilZ domain